MAESNIAWLPFVGAIIGAVPALLGAVAPWLKDRDRIAKEKRATELAKLEVEFVSTWIDAASKLSGDETTALKALARARLQRLLGDEPRAEPRAAIAPRGSTTSLRAKTLFLMYLGFFVFMIFGASIDGAGNLSLRHLVNELSGDGAGVLILFTIPLVALLFWWRRATKRAEMAQGPA